ncbi:unnamed protein product [Parnassius apollo]|uniref:(apollo) hypothetical protein n=1 Tax=Parnassius apollo TaxID=110799 RepID=A0A8S3WNJ8_PARAO|nr:unnamed protein product [Parnassius apollo]
MAILKQDRRGKRENHAHLDPLVKDSIRKHLDSIPKVDSHYCTADTKRTYIEGGKTVADLHRDYVAECKSKGLPFGNYLAYYNIFCTEYNMAFFKPKKDQCETCTNYTNATEEDKQIKKHDYELHLKEKQLARDQRDEDKNYTPDNCIVSVYDLQAAMSFPKDIDQGVQKFPDQVAFPKASSPCKFYCLKNIMLVPRSENLLLVNNKTA